MTLEQPLEHSCTLAFVTDQHFDIRWMMIASSKALVNDCLLRFNASQTLNLSQGSLERYPIVGIAMMCLNRDNPVGCCCGYHCHFAPKLVVFVRLAFGNTFDFWGMNALRTCWSLVSVDDRRAWRVQAALAMP